MEKLADLMKEALAAPSLPKLVVYGSDVSEPLGIPRLNFVESKEKVIFPLDTLDGVDLDNGSVKTDYGWVFHSSQVVENSIWSKNMEKLGNRCVANGLCQGQSGEPENRDPHSNSRKFLSEVVSPVHVELAKVVFQEDVESSGMKSAWKVAAGEFSGDTFGLLLVVPPGCYSGGGVQGTSSNGERLVFNFGDENPEKEYHTHFCAFSLENCEVAVAPVSSGSRALLVYTLKWSENGALSNSARSFGEVVKETGEVLQELRKSDLSKGKLAFVELRGTYSRSQLWNKGFSAFNAEDKKIVDVIRAAKGNLNIGEVLCCVQGTRQISLNSKSSSMRLNYGPWMTMEGGSMAIMPNLDASQLKQMKVFNEELPEASSFRTDEGTVVTYPAFWLLVLYAKDEEFKVTARADPGKAMDKLEQAHMAGRMDLMKQLMVLWAQDDEACLLVLGKVDLIVRFLENVAEVAESDPDGAEEVYRHFLGLLASHISARANDELCGVESAEMAGRRLLNIIAPLKKCCTLLDGSLKTIECFIKNIPLGLAQLTASLALAIADNPQAGKEELTGFLNTAKEKFKQALIKFISMTVLPGKWNTVIMGLLLMERFDEDCDVYLMRPLIESKKTDLTVFLLEVDTMVLQHEERRTAWWRRFLGAFGHMRAAERPLAIEYPIHDDDEGLEIQEHQDGYESSASSDYPMGGRGQRPLCGWSPGAQTMSRKRRRHRL